MLADIPWPEENEMSPEARDLIDKLLCSNPTERLGYHVRLSLSSLSLSLSTHTHTYTQIHTISDLL